MWDFVYNASEWEYKNNRLVLLTQGWQQLLLPSFSFCLWHLCLLRLVKLGQSVDPVINLCLGTETIFSLHWLAVQNVPSKMSRILWRRVIWKLSFLCPYSTVCFPHSSNTDPLILHLIFSQHCVEFTTWKSFLFLHTWLPDTFHTSLYLMSLHIRTLK